MSDGGREGEFVYCSSCGARIGATVRFCTSCGASQAEHGEIPPGDVPPEGAGAAPEEETVQLEPEPQPEPQPASSPPPPPAPGPAAQDRKPGFFESLLDTTFESLITPKLIRVVYVLSMIVLAIGAAVTIIASFAVDSATGVLFLFLAPVSALIYLILIRLWLELIVVVFKVRDAAEQIAENTGD